MQVILLERIEKLGGVGDIVTVKNGYARNYLIPQQKCLRATNENKAFYEAQRSAIEKENEDKRKDAEKVAKDIDGKFFVLLRQAGEDNRLYGSVTTRDIAKEVIAKGVQVNKNQLSLDQSIKYLGVYTVKVAVHPEVVVPINVNVARTESEAKEAEKEFLNPTPKKDDEAKLLEETAALAAAEAAAKAEEETIAGLAEIADSTE